MKFTFYVIINGKNEKFLYLMTLGAKNDNICNYADEQREKKNQNHICRKTSQITYLVFFSI